MVVQETRRCVAIVDGRDVVNDNRMSADVIELHGTVFQRSDKAKRESAAVLCRL